MSVVKVKTQDIPGYLYYTSLAGRKPSAVVLHAFNQKPEDVERYSREFAALGMIALAPRYTDASDGVSVALRALKKLKTLSGLDPEKLGLFGVSLGGTVSLLASTQERVRFVVSIGGWVDLADLYKFLSKFPHGTPQKYIADLVRSTLGDPEENKEIYELASPITYVDKVSGSVLLIHGSEDSMVPASQSEAMYRKLRELGRDVEYRVVEGGGHALLGRESVVIDLTLKFLKDRGIL
ncbi:MAG: prolyl oligopeptidase family serine peptidase [Sulfolobales archaeon]|nr:prolyl oligopeptidase family serine peptidase [Sulfolobales archaeon]MCX8208156.1 prolyl oligopeptidase family serine peptidase [Sulfolobales archaeon]MDW8010594.1 prolyl oligopeptidase family serine peptidase [Sulfolobales archaeon]